MLFHYWNVNQTLIFSQKFRPHGAFYTLKTSENVLKKWDKHGFCYSSNQLDNNLKNR
jgi:hypothetical protein